MWNWRFRNETCWRDQANENFVTRPCVIDFEERKTDNISTIYINIINMTKRNDCALDVSSVNARYLHELYIYIYIIFIYIYFFFSTFIMYILKSLLYIFTHTSLIFSSSENKYCGKHSWINYATLTRRNVLHTLQRRWRCSYISEFNSSFARLRDFIRVEITSRVYFEIVFVDSQSKDTCRIRPSLLKHHNQFRLIAPQQALLAHLVSIGDV